MNEKTETELRAERFKNALSGAKDVAKVEPKKEMEEEIKEEPKKENIKEVVKEVKEIANNQVGILVEIEIEKLIPYSYRGEKQPFNEYNQKKYDEVKSSIQLHGLHEPIIVRKVQESDKYQILAGHNRTNIFKDLGKNKIPALIVECDDEKARLIMVETNIMKRDFISPMERARAYKIQKEVYNNKKYGEQENIIIKTILDENNTSKSNFYRYLSLNNLIPEFQGLVDNNFNIKNAEQISYLKPEEQKTLFSLLNDKKVKVNENKLRILKSLSNESSSNLSEKEITNCFKEGLKVSTDISISFNNEELEKYFSADMNKKDIKELVIKALDKYYN